VANSLLWVWFCAPPDPPRQPDAPKAPLIDVRLFLAHPQIATTCLRGMVTFIAFYTVFYGLPQWLQVSRGLDPAQAGLLMFPVFGVGALSTLAATRLARRRSPEEILTVGNSAFILAGVVLMTTAGPDSSLLLLTLAAALLGIPTGFNNLGNQITLHHAAPAAVAGGASGLYRTFQYIGAALSAVLVAHLVPATDEGGPARPQAGVRHIGQCLVVIGILLLATMLVRRYRRPGRGPAVNEPGRAA
jgi:predicted MFS family arabinose efflux permease